MKICPEFSKVKGEETPCLRKACAWFQPENVALQTPEECVFVSINRNLLDIRLTIEQSKK